MDLFDQVSEDIKNAMKAKDKVALETLRNIKKFFLEAKTARCQRYIDGRCSSENHPETSETRKKTLPKFI